MRSQLGSVLLLGGWMAVSAAWSAMPDELPAVHNEPVTDLQVKGLRDSAASLEGLRSDATEALSRVSAAVGLVEGVAVGSLPGAALNLDEAFWQGCTRLAHDSGQFEESVLKRQATTLDQACNNAREAVAALGKVSGADRATLETLLPKDGGRLPADVDWGAVRTALGIRLGRSTAESLQQLSDQLFALSGSLQSLSQQRSRNAFVESGIERPKADNEKKTQ